MNSEERVNQKRKHIILPNITNGLLNITKANSDPIPKNLLSKAHLNHIKNSLRIFKDYEKKD